MRVLNGNAEDMLRALRCGDVDFVIGLVREPSQPDLVNEAVAETPYVVVARHGHPLAGKRKVTLEDLAEYDWVVGTPGSHRRSRFEGLFDAKRRPTARIATGSLPIIRVLLAQSDRLTLLTTYELMFEDDALIAVPFGPIEPVPAVGLTMRENWLPTQLQRNFLDLIQKRIVGSLSVTKDLAKELRNIGLPFHEYQADQNQSV